MHTPNSTMALFTCGFEQFRFYLVSKEWHFPCSENRAVELRVQAATAEADTRVLLTSVFQYDSWEPEFPSDFIFHL